MATRKKSTVRTLQSRKNSRSWWQNLQISQWLILSIVLTFIAFLPSLSNGITSWDDNIYITENPMIFEWSVENLKAIFSQPVAGNYHPITMLSLAINYQFSGVEPFGYHLMNLLLHLLNVVLVFYFVWLLSKGKKWVAFTSAILFGIHPMHLESVAWIAERKDVLYAFFFLLGLISYLHFRLKKEPRLYAFTFVWFLLSVLSKPAAVVFPLVLILLDYWRYEQSSSKRKRWDWQKIIVPKIPFFIVSLIIGIVTLKTQSEGAISELDTFTFFQKFVFVCYGFVMYVVKAIFPFQLSAFYDYPNLNVALPVVYQIMPIAAIAIIAAVWYSWRYTKIIGLGVAFFFVNIVLVMQFISVGAAVMADRYTYLPYIGIFIVLGYGFDKLMRQQQTKTIVTVIAAAYVIALSFLTFQRTKVWENDETIWTDVLKKYPNSVVALNNRAAYYNKEEQLDAALKDYNRTLQLKPKYFDALVGRSSLYHKMGEFDKSLKDAQLAISINAKDERPYVNIGGVYFKQQKHSEAIEAINKALAINPNNAESLINRGVLYSIIKNFKQSIPDFDRYIRLRPNDVKGYLYQGISYKNLKQNQKAINNFNKALQIEPQNGQAYLARSETYLQMDNKAQALKDAQKAKALGFQVSQQYLEGLQ
ncbi:MAG: tetratricopeptide repeat protein [Chitinophagales bacterium]